MKLKETAPYIIAFASSLVRYYDYALFGLSAVMISQRFMPEGESEDQLLAFFFIYSLAMLARPLGSLIFGKIGDNIGRILAVKISIFLAAFSTFMIALIPSYEQIGWLAIILLTICRMIFLASLAGEVDIVKIYVAEKIGPKYRHLTNGFVSFFAQMGCLIAAFAYHMAISASPESVDLLWRVNFIYGGIAGLVLLFFRGYYIESALFLKNKAKVTSAKDSIVTIIRKNALMFTLSIIANGVSGASYNFLIIFLGNFAANILGLIDQEAASATNIILITSYALSCLFSGFLACRIPPTQQVWGSLIMVIILAGCFTAFLQGDLFFKEIQILMVLLVPFYVIPMQIKLQSLFKTEERVQMYSLSHSLGSLIFSSSIPFCSMLIWKYTSSVLAIMLLFIALLLMLLQVVSYIAKKQYSDEFEA